MRPFALIVSMSLCAAHTVFAGPLDPPAGGVAPTMKTLSEVEPRIALSAENTPGDDDSYYKITNPGSYYLTENTTIPMLASDPRHGIEVAASDVTIDLNGYTLEGLGGTLCGVYVGEPDLGGVVIANGVIRGFFGDGIDGQTMEAERCEVRGVRVTGPAGYGIRLGENAVVVDCMVSDAGLSGVFVRARSRVTDCTVSGCGQGGVGTANASHGIQALAGSVVSSCVVTDNAENGIYVGSGSTVTGCVATSNGAVGIDAFSYGLVVDCVSSENSLSGFSVGLGTLVRSCVSDSNLANGILGSISCTIVDNACTNNAGAGLRLSGARSRVEGNNLLSNTTGMLIESSDNLVIRNACVSNITNWDIAEDNRVAPIVEAGQNAAAINGDTYTGSLGTTDPNANFTYKATRGGRRK